MEQESCMVAFGFLEQEKMPTEIVQLNDYGCQDALSAKYYFTVFARISAYIGCIRYNPLLSPRATPILGITAR